MDRTTVRCGFPRVSSSHTHTLLVATLTPAFNTTILAFAVGSARATLRVNPVMPCPWDGWTVPTYRDYLFNRACSSGYLVLDWTAHLRWPYD